MPGEKLIQSANIWLFCTNYVISEGLLWWIKFSTQKGSQNCKNISKGGKKWKLKYGIVASTFNIKVFQVFQGMIFFYHLLFYNPDITQFGYNKLISLSHRTFFMFIQSTCF